METDSPILSPQIRTNIDLASRLQSDQPAQTFVYDEDTAQITSQETRRWPIQRSLSSPNVRTLTDEEEMSASSADKRKNKLGYHRTAVACGKPLSNPIAISRDNRNK